MPAEDTLHSKITAFFSKSKAIRIKKGSVIIYPGDEVKYAYQLVSGKVKQYSISNKGDEIVLNMFKPPAFFPMSHIMNKTPAIHTFEAAADIVVHQAPADEAVAFLRQNPDVLYDLISRVYIGTDGLLGRIEQLMAGNAKERLIYEIITEARRFGKAGNRGSCTIQLSEKDLGARAGLTRETINREIKKLKQENLLSVTKSGIHIIDITKLEDQLD